MMNNLEKRINKFRSNKLFSFIQIIGKRQKEKSIIDYYVMTKTSLNLQNLIVNH